MEEISIGSFPERTGVQPSAEFLKTLTQRIREKFGSVSAFCRNTTTPALASETMRNLLKAGTSKKQLIPLTLLVRCCNACEIPVKHLQQNVVAYGLRRGSILVRNPILPVPVDPVFDMVIAHQIGDGYVTDPKRGRHPYFGYRQFDLLYRLLYFEKLQWIFGEINFDYERAWETTQIYCPGMVSFFFFTRYDLGTRDFLSESALLPKEILAKPKENLLSVLIAFLIDEGHIEGSCMEIRLKNRPLIAQLQRICEMLCYPSTVSYEPDHYAVLYILSEGVRRFWKDYLEIIKKYPVMDLGWKGRAIANYIRSQQRPLRNVPGNKTKIISVLEKESLTVNEIAERVQMTRQGARYLVACLVNEQRIRKVGIAKFGADRYGAIT